MSQSTDDLSWVRAFSHPRPLQLYDKSRRAPLVCLATGTSQSLSARVTGGSGASRPGREGALRRRVGRMQCDSAKQPD